MNINSNQEFYDNFEIKTTNNSTIIFVVAVSKEPSQNHTQKIRPRSGAPIYGYVYDVANDNLCVNCVDYTYIATIPIAFRASMKQITDWNVRIPIPYSIFEQYLTGDQIHELNLFKKRYPECNMEFVQAIGVL